MIFSAALKTESAEGLRAHLIRTDGQEDVCFAIYRPSTGAGRRSVLIGMPILPLAGEREVHGNASFGSEYFLRAAEIAADADAGLALLHSHPRGSGWQGMSRDDIAAERGHSAQVLALTGLPFVGLTVTASGDWSARLWERVGRGEFVRRDFETVRIVGSRLDLTFNDELRPPPPESELLVRTTAAWGPETQAKLARLRVGVVGAGSVGALIAETLARTGIEEVSVIDFDAVQAHNLDRLLHATRADAARGRPKIEMLAEALRDSATSPRFDVQGFEYSVTEPEGFAAALDCDVLFSCVDRPWPRLVLNQIAYAHLIPVVDGGIRFDSCGGERLVSAEYRAHIAAPGRRCLACLGQYDPGLVQAERDGLLDDPSYLDNLPDDHPLKSNQNVFAASMLTAGLEFDQLLSMIAGSPGLSDNGAQTYHSHLGSLDIDTRGCERGCHFAERHVGAGDDLQPLVGPHRAAQQARTASSAPASRTPNLLHPGRFPRLVSRVQRHFRRRS